MDKNTNTRESQFIRFNWFIQSVGMYPKIQLICITNTYPIQSLSLMFGVGSQGLLESGDRAISKTNAMQKKHKYEYHKVTVHSFSLVHTTSGDVSNGPTNPTRLM